MRNTPRTRHLLAAGAAGAAVALSAAILPTLPAGAIVADLPGHSSEPSSLDARDGASAVAPTQAQLDAVKRILAAAPKGARATWDEDFGTPRTMLGGDGYLTGPLSGSAVEVARAWVSDNRGAFGMSAAQVEALVVSRDHTLPGTGTSVVTFTQVFDGVEAVHGGRLNVAVTKDGRVLSYGGNPTRGTGTTGSFALSPAAALGAVARDLAPAQDFAGEATGEQAGYTTFAKGPFAAGSYVKKVAFPTEAAPARRTACCSSRSSTRPTTPWWTPSPARSCSARAWWTTSPRAPCTRTSRATPARAGHPPSSRSAPPPSRQVATSTRPVWPVCPDRRRWATTPAPTPTTRTSSVRSTRCRPVSATSQFNYTYDMNWQESKGATVPPSYALDLNPAATNLFFHHNRIHDEFYDFGFTESAGNFELDGGDPILGLVHAGAASGGAPTYTGRDNAYMLTLPDGIAPWSGMFLWEPINDAFEGPYSDGNFDAGVIEHEYAHGLSNRYVAGGSALGSHQSGSMGEGWGDWYALNYLHREGLAESSVVGEYVTGNAARGIRNWAYDENPTGFGDVGYDLSGPEVHSDGEIWTTTLWDLRKKLVEQYGQAQGSEVVARLVSDAMPLSAPDPSFLDMRDAILAADVDRYHGDNSDTVWTVFATRGAGVSASTATGDDTDPTPGFDHAAASRNGQLSGTVLNASNGKPVANAKVIVGEYEARVSPLARTSDTGTLTAPMVAGTYDLLVQAPGFGAQRFTDIPVTAGATKSLTMKVSPNLASLAAGATLVSTSSEDAGLPGTFLLDDTAASVWSTKKDGSAYNSGPDQRVTVKLAKAATIDRIQVSAFKNTTGSRFAALKDFTFQVSTDGVLWKTVKKGGFGYQTPRPAAPDLNYRTFTLDTPVRASHVRFFIDSVHGETLKYAQAAELQVFGPVRQIEPTAPPADAPFTDSGTLAAGNPATGEVVERVIGVTGTEFEQTCPDPYAAPVSQGGDGWISPLPAGFGDGTHTVTVTGAETPAGHDIDLYFMDATCAVIGAQATSAADESGVIPGGAAYVLTQLWTGADVPFTLEAVDAG